MNNLKFLTKKKNMRMLAITAPTIYSIYKKLLRKIYTNCISGTVFVQICKICVELKTGIFRLQILSSHRKHLNGFSKKISKFFHDFISNY